MTKKALLMILDGWGIGKHGKGDVIYNTPTPYLDYLTAVSAHSELQASGENVGLPDGQMGNSEVGHLNIGAGRVVYQDLVKINRACKDGSILENGAVGTGAVDFHQVLVNDAASADIEVAHFGVTHLSVGQTNVFARSQQLGVRIGSVEVVHKRSWSLEDDVTFAVTANAPTVENHQESFFCHRCKLFTG